MELLIELPVNQFEKLQEIADYTGILPEKLANAAIRDFISATSEDFRSAADYVLIKNEELYRRLA